MNIKKNKSLLEFNTFGVDVTAAQYIKVTSEEEIISAINLSEKSKIKPFMMGGGSNMLLTEPVFDRAVIHVQSKGIEVIDDDNSTVTIECAPGEKWDDVVAFCVSNGWGGVENLSFIPGTVGAAPIQNIGAYGQEVKDTLQSVRVFLTDQKKIKEFKNSECKFGYRNSIFKNSLKEKAVILNVRLKLKKEPKLNISYKGVREIIFRDEGATPGLKEIRDAIITLRKEKLPDPAELGNAGSFFKNPEISEESFAILHRFSPEIDGFKTKEGKMKISAAKLIELAGWKGKREGDCGVSEKHSLVLVNYGKATGAELKAFAMAIIDDIFNKFAIKLTPEVNIY
ncbi:MAG: UDP-N-acetylmuramate dehydrogenase [Ignavibacteriales bacterium]|nr:MAG: UDP-N-acetylmuramate dehydrogenase [Ignavibacteriaceae bacterium]MBW7871799.1 UDP-N-acetylmuramate dehydrogenase [Ignavibacteria bacterium]MCZ2144351.1 UDP-N-acetylmuramate dehydrogenase [Ignavibacteriales bacterium]OQY75529.1 MAG: UDP-N-acetylenolpyruvoylglucosamine reductase [Ignavibacteriales bacterium UTCHB3]MBV6446304.1 UDP-N-acetylenolpyruvoylglucosamine reductase [Ignavibacteriaceae bacterium]